MLINCLGVAWTFCRVVNFEVCFHFGVGFFDDPSSEFQIKLKPPLGFY